MPLTARDPSFRPNPLKRLVSEFAETVDIDLAEDCHDAFEGAMNCRECFRQQFFSGDPVDYNCDQKRYLYVASYLPVHVREISLSLDLVPGSFVDRMFTQDSLYVLSLGGGPGCDILAAKQTFLEWEEDLGDKANEMEIRLTRFEKHEHWNPIARRVIHLCSDSENLRFEERKWIGDITIEPEWPVRRQDANIFVLSYILSELSDNEATTVAQLISNKADDDLSAVVVNDIQEGRVMDRIDRFLDDLPTDGSEVKTRTNSVHCNIQYSQRHKNKVEPKLMTSSIRYMKILSFRPERRVSGWGNVTESGVW